MPDYVLLVGAALITVLIFVTLLRTRHFFRALLFSAATGNAALFSVAYLGAFTGVILSPNLFTVAVSTTLGIPGVLTMLLVKLLLAG